ncbi:MAG: putative lipid II flippase FtsW [Zetaproteobacteria bacterium CG_4_9_14_3_um_filter_49_83]|nr:MAG: putative lipid II flippase FtsW [Zetaproteobacteria bacterium CG1_02_49_23]PIQ34444.1 MAG: putative lipid II flippase FtsW [Zetaproteobacteria bacterium CG17_big_fil_post_rev_8_21_14_2_50_50_13]PIV29053.1 MAG: putative lipid II flippase FtsW [Zetaproteobacteria bacterium CG02_land_8_20_14_3_00_50_9]PIY56427.1 MAG: putative lipid II flippase FtsW [Zetaproteobacteria bacterium CG_4_10_14_0_8_um_filter_49_80]PJA34066.1 MAG: putative lipid II flippase FtsW [Zetaproteobacteria bacterium CG_4
MKACAKPDSILLSCVLALLLLSVLMVSSASLSVAEIRYGDPFQIIQHWLVYIPIGLVLLWITSRVDPVWWKSAALPLVVVAFLVMLGVLLLGQRINGATRWFSLFGMSFQPVEILKPMVVVYMAYYLSSFTERLNHFATGLAPMLIILMVSVMLLMLQPDFGNAVLLTLTCIGLWFLGGVPFRHLGGMALMALPLALVAIIAEPYRAKRFFSFTDPWADPLGSGYQLAQSMIAFGSGGLTGTGLGQGVQKLFYLPEGFTDFIAAVMGEELGLPGTAALIAIFAVMIGRSFYLVYHHEDAFQRLLVCGCIMLIGFSFMINMGAVMGMIPTKGMPIPFLSYGGSALFGNCILMGVILSVQRHAKSTVSNSYSSPRLVT